MGVVLTCIENMPVGSRVAVQVYVPVGVGALREVVVVQRAHDWQSQSEQRQRQQQQPPQRRRVRRAD